jgi:hypothetical protein
MGSQVDVMTRSERLGQVSLVLILGALGCSQGKERFKAPKVDAATSATAAIELYDADGNGKLDEKELIKCPGILGKLAAYDKNGDGSVDRAEIESQLAELLKHGTGGTQLSCLVTYKRKPLVGAEVVLEPEPYLGEEIQTARGRTNGSGSAPLTIPPEFLPSHLQRMKAVHYGTFKVRITHPEISIPEKYNTATELGYQTEIGNPTVRFELN